MMQKLKVGTRSSPLALIQAQRVCDQLRRRNVETEIITIQTSGDKNQTKSLADLGGKVLFAKELQQALLNDDIDLAVHSLKDLETTHPKGLKLLATLERDHVGDVFITPKGCAQKYMQSSGPEFILGTCSPRREYFIKNMYSNVRVKPLRGNIGRRLKTLEDGIIDATIMAAAAIQRLNIKNDLEKKFDLILLDQNIFTPASCQGIIGVEGKESFYDLMQYISHAPTYAQSVIERYAVECFQGTCHSAIGALSTIKGDTFWLKIQYASPKTGKMTLSTIDGKIQHYKTIIENSFK
jgi:hydroxymethylbilane synthase